MRRWLTDAQWSALLLVAGGGMFFDAKTGGAKNRSGGRIDRRTLNAIHARGLVAYDTIESGRLLLTPGGIAQMRAERSREAQAKA